MEMTSCGSGRRKQNPCCERSGWIAARSFAVPERIGESVVANAQFVPVINDLAPSEEIRYDDVGVYRLAE